MEFLKFIRKLRARPGMYVLVRDHGLDPDYTDTCNFILGACFSSDSNPLHGFESWLKKKLKLKTGKFAWPVAIRFAYEQKIHSKYDFSADLIETMHELIEEFLRNRGNNKVIEIFFGNIVPDKESLLRMFSDELSFPGYFGHNWDALNDSLRDYLDQEGFELTLNHTGNDFSGREWYDIYRQIISDIDRDYVNLTIEFHVS